jgi:retron-type reverse transcriptase
MFSYFFFQFRKEFFGQSNGLPIGAPLSPLLANIFVENIETTAIDSYFFIHFWDRYMDDVISVRDYGRRN